MDEAIQQYFSKPSRLPQLLFVIGEGVLYVRAMHPLPWNNLNNQEIMTKEVTDNLDGSTLPDRPDGSDEYIQSMLIHERMQLSEDLETEDYPARIKRSFPSCKRGIVAMTIIGVDDVCINL